ncbi:hypothetical protein MMPV_003036 [Pyropia vietnamensis]
MAGGGGGAVATVWRPRWREEAAERAGVCGGGGPGPPPAARLAVWAPLAAPALVTAGTRSFEPAVDTALALTAAALCLWWVPMRTASALAGYGPGAECVAALAARGVGGWGQLGGGCPQTAANNDPDAKVDVTGWDHAAHAGSSCALPRLAMLLLLPAAYATRRSVGAGTPPLTTTAAAAATAATAVGVLILGAGVASRLAAVVPASSGAAALGTLGVMAGRCVWLAAHTALAAGGAISVTSVATAVAAAAGCAVHPPFGMPFPAASLADFWGRQWNRPAAQLLRYGVYEPVRDALCWAGRLRWGGPSPLKPAGGRGQGGGEAVETTRMAAVRAAAPAAIAVVATFLVSGIAHEAILVVTSAGVAAAHGGGAGGGSGDGHGDGSHGEWLLFFGVHGMAVVVERAVGWVAPRRGGGHTRGGRRTVAQVVALIFLAATADAWFFPPVIRLGVRDRGLADLTRVFRWWETYRKGGVGAY